MFEAAVSSSARWLKSLQVAASTYWERRRGICRTRGSHGHTFTFPDAHRGIDEPATACTFILTIDTCNFAIPCLSIYET